MFADLRLCVKPAAGVIEVHLLLRIKAPVFRRAQRVHRVRASSLFLYRWIEPALALGQTPWVNPTGARRINQYWRNVRLNRPSMPRAAGAVPGMMRETPW